MKEHNFVFIISDGLGETGELVVKAALSQFKEETHIRKFSYVLNKDNIKDIVLEAKEYNSLIAYTLVLPEMEKYLQEIAKKYNIKTVDLLGPSIRAMTEFLQKKPILEPGLIRKLDEKYFRKVDAIDFAVKYDDGKDPKGLLYSDIAIIGVSRTSKTPLCMYLAHKRMRAANLPLVPEATPPEELFNIPKNKVFGLIIKPELLYEIRAERLRSLGLNDDADYANKNRIIAELEYAKDIMNTIGCHIIDVTNKAVEETANIILELYKEGELYGN